MWFWRRQHPQLNFKSKGEVGTQIFYHLRFQVFTSTQIGICSLLTSIQKLPVEVIGLMQKSDVQNWSCLVARWFFGPNHFESSFGWVNQRRKGFCWVLQTFRSRLRPSTRSTFWVCHLLRIVASAPKNPRKKVKQILSDRYLEVRYRALCGHFVGQSMSWKPLSIMDVSLSFFVPPSWKTPTLLFPWWVSFFFLKPQPFRLMRHVLGR